MLKNALRLYEAVILKTEEGAQFFYQMPGGEIAPYQMFTESENSKEA